MALPLHARHAMLGSVSGKHRSPVRGSSLEFAQYRKYVPGDDTRRLDWRTWGRSDRFYIKEFEADTNLRICLLIDTSGSMGFGPAGATRLDYARKLAGTLGYLAAQQGDAVGPAQPRARSRWRFPRKRGAGASRPRARPAWRTSSRSAARRCSTALHDAAENIRQRALVVIFSDFFVPPAELKSRHPASAFPASTTWRRFTCSTRRNSISISTSPRTSSTWKAATRCWPIPRSSRAIIATAVRQYLAEMDELVRTTGIDYHRVKLHERYDDVLVRFLLGRTPKRASR